MKLVRTKKKKWTYSIINPEMFENFKKEYPKYKDMTYEEFEKRWDEITETTRDEAITNPLGVKLGFYMGELKYQYLPYKYKGLDRSTMLEEEQRNFVSLNTKGKMGKVKWERRWAVKFNKILQLYAFTPYRALNIAAKKHTDENPHMIRMSRVTTGGSSVWRKKI